MEFEAHILYHLSGIQIFYLQHYRCILRHHALGLWIFINNTADHHVDDIVFCTVLCDQSSYICTISHDGNSVRDHFDLIHTVRDIHNTHVLFSQVTDDLEQFLNLSLCQRCGWLIEYDHLRIMGNCLCNLTHLLLSYGQPAHGLSWINIYIQSLKKLSGLIIHPLVIDADALFELPPNEDVLCNRQMAQHIQLLMHNNNPCILCLFCT